MLELQGEHRNLGNQQVAADKGADEYDPFQTFKGDTMLLQTYDERTPKECIGRGGESDESQSLSFVKIELGQSESREGCHDESEEWQNEDVYVEIAEISEDNRRRRKTKCDVISQGVELFSDRGGNAQKSGCHSIEEIEDCTNDDKQQSQLEVALESEISSNAT